MMYFFQVELACRYTREQILDLSTGYRAAVSQRFRRPSYRVLRNEAVAPMATH